MSDAPKKSRKKSSRSKKRSTSYKVAASIDNEHNGTNNSQRNRREKRSKKSSSRTAAALEKKNPAIALPTVYDSSEKHAVKPVLQLSPKPARQPTLLEDMYLTTPLTKVLWICSLLACFIIVPGLLVASAINTDANVPCRQADGAGIGLATWGIVYAAIIIIFSGIQYVGHAFRIKKLRQLRRGEITMAQFEEKGAEQLVKVSQCVGCFPCIWLVYGIATMTRIGRREDTICQDRFPRLWAFAVATMIYLVVSCCITIFITYYAVRAALRQQQTAIELK